MEIKLKDLVVIQKEVNEKVREKIQRDVFTEEYILAFNVEFFEFLNEIGTWKWWKHSHVLKKERILDELADLFAFFLSIVINHENEIPVEEFEKELTELVENIFTNKEKEGKEIEALVNSFAIMVGTDNEHPQERAIPTLSRFAIAIALVRFLYDGITYEEIIEAFKAKSQENIDRQNRNY